MRQILILTGKNDGKTAILNLSPTHTYTITFDSNIPQATPNSTSIIGKLEVLYANCLQTYYMKFLDAEDAREFEQSLIEYLMNGATPVQVEEDKAEIRYWFEFEVLEINNV